MDGVVLDLLKAASKGDAKVTPADLNKVISETVKDSSSVLSYELVVPGVDARTGLFTAYRLIANGTYSSDQDAWQPGQEFIDVKRIVGMAYAGPDGAIYWQGVDNVDTANYQGYLPKGGKPMEILRLEGIEVWNEAGTRTLDDQSVVQLRLTKVDDGSTASPTADGVAAVLKRLQASLPLQTLKEDDTVGRR
ncbi:hypothetical protein COHA_007768 [Chlorella ohadii]|uniref:Uncharacterized protein n=1 Tax=Chlorella ohadii TaxID=2649997 RepID=A0AAD5H3Y4_9CHLO|nr:hypothetical protein COHA_007768 [Chlorella ohadii]